MFQSKGDYDRGVNTFSPEGRLFQVEYALEAVKLGSTAVGICTSQGVVLAVEKRLPSPLVVASSIEKILKIDSHIGCAMSGLSSDARTLVEHARVETQNHSFTYDEPMPVEACVHSVADMALDFSDDSDDKKKEKKKTMARPFGVALLIAGVDAAQGACLFQTEPSGTYTKFKAAAIGSAADAATSLLIEHFKPEMTLVEAETLSLFVLRQVMEDKINCSNVEIASARISDLKFSVYSLQETQTVIARLPAPTLPQLHQPRK
jgi:20S proteasome subunit alpha 5